MEGRVDGGGTFTSLISASPELGKSPKSDQAARRARGLQ